MAKRMKEWQISRGLLVLLIWGIVTVCRAVDIISPDGAYVMTIGEEMRWTLAYQGEMIVEESQLGMAIDNRLFESALGIPRGEHKNWCRDMVLKSIDQTEVDTTWVPVYGENAAVRDHYRQVILHYEKGGERKGPEEGGYDKRQFYAMDIVVRAYNEGIAFRYHFPETSNGLFLHITGEQTSFKMPEGTEAWYEEWAQGPYEKRQLRGEWYECERPLLLRQPSGIYMALLEAEMRDFVRGKFRLKRDDELEVALYSSADVISPYSTPWRVVMAARKAVELVNHKDLILNLNEPSQVADTDFIRPGKAFRCGQLNKEAIYKSIDYCAERGIDYVELDAGWYGAEGKVSSDARTVAANRDFSMPDICDYAQKKGVGVWIYVNQRALFLQLDELLPLYRSWGIKGVKFGFVQVGNQQWSMWLHDAIRKCGEHGIMVDVHDEYRPTGVSRTYPHLLTQEGIRGNEEMPDATHNTLLPFTRFLCGPADYTLCYFNSRIKGTKGHQLAMAAVYYSPLQFLFWYDVPYADKGEEELEFWWNCPTVFDESRALMGEPGEFIVQLRRSGSEYFVGTLTNTESRTVTIPTDFLPDHGKYMVTIYNDDPTLNTRTKVNKTRQVVRPNKPLTLHLQPSGGAALHFKPL